MSTFNANVVFNSADQALMTAIEKLNLRAVCRALDQGANPNLIHADGKSIVLELASRQYSTDSTIWTIVQELILAGADHLVTDAEGETLIHHAARCDEVDAIETLIAMDGLDVDVLDSEGRTPLFNAAAFSRVEAITVLLEYGADPLVTSNPDGVMGPDYQPIDAIDYEDAGAFYVQALLNNAMEEAEGEEA